MGKILSIVGDYDQFTFFIYFKQYLQQLGLRGSLQRWGKRLSWWNIPHMISCLPIWTCLIILPKNKNIFQSWFIDGDNVLSHLSLHRHQQNANYFHLSWWWRRLLLDIYILILGLAKSPYNWGYNFFCLYQYLFEIIIVHIFFTVCVLLFHSSSHGWGN